MAQGTVGRKELFGFPRIAQRVKVQPSIEVASALKTGPEVLSDPTLVDKVIALGGGWRDEPPLGPSRDELLSLVGAAA